MFRIPRFVPSMLLLAALASPAAIAQDHDRDHDRNGRGHDRQQNARIYDRDHKDYHTWNDDEDRTYRQWWGEQHQNGYRAYNKLNAKQQREYWKWRHDHGDVDRH